VKSLGDGSRVRDPGRCSANRESSAAESARVRQITVGEARQICDWIEVRRQLIGTQELAQRVSALELSQKANTPPPARLPGPPGSS
jgi:hypothetical protein